MPGTIRPGRCLLFVLVAVSALARSDELTPLPLVRVADNVYTAVGVTGPPTLENGGHNNNLSVIITDAGLFVVNAGASSRLARRFHLAIQALSTKRVVWVSNENGQGHAFLGNGYWKDQGAKLVAHTRAIEEMRTHGAAVLSRMKTLNGVKAEGTRVTIPEHGFEDIRVIDLGGTRIELRYFGKAHSPGDISVWLPQQKLLIAGDLAFHQRLLAIFPDTEVAAWIESFDRMAALQPEIIVPGHGSPTDLATVRRETQDYLRFLTSAVTDILDRDGDLADAYRIDQSPWAYLDTFEELAGKNAGRLFQTMELEYF